MKRAIKGFRVLMNNNHSPPKQIAEVILEAITSKDPEVRYLVSDDAEEIMKVRKNASDKEFENWMYKRIFRERQGRYTDNCTFLFKGADNHGKKR